MNPASWTREHQIAGLLFATAGALAGVVWAWLDSPFYRICKSPGGFADCPNMLLVWLGHPSQYWVLGASGALVPFLILWGFQLMRSDSANKL